MITTPDGYTAWDSGQDCGTGGWDFDGLDSAMVITGEDGKTPVAGVSIREATPDNRELAVTNDTGVATVTLEKDPTQQNALYISGTRFSIERTALANKVSVDRAMYDRLKRGLPAIPEEGQTRSTVHYEVTDSDTGQKLTVPAGNPLVVHPRPNPLPNTTSTRSADSEPTENGEIVTLVEVEDVGNVTITASDTDTNHIIGLASPIMGTVIVPFT